MVCGALDNELESQELFSQRASPLCSIYFAYINAALHSWKNRKMCFFLCITMNEMRRRYLLSLRRFCSNGWETAPGNPGATTEEVWSNIEKDWPSILWNIYCIEVEICHSGRWFSEAFYVIVNYTLLMANSSSQQRLKTDYVLRDRVRVLSTLSLIQWRLNSSFTNARSFSSH